MQTFNQNRSQKINLLLALSGSVATIKVEQMLIKLFQTQKFNIKVITTQSAKHFFQFQQLKGKFNGKGSFYEDSDEYSTWKKRGDPVLHIQLRKWADLMIVAPLSANTLAKFNAGICDNLLTLVFRCWNMNKNQQGKLVSPIILCPAMNNLMYDHPLTQQHLTKMRSFGCIIIDSIEKVLVCGQKGKGAMEQVDKIVKILLQLHSTFSINKQKSKLTMNESKA